MADAGVRYAELSTASTVSLAGQVSSLDPNVAYTSHALGTYAARAAVNGGSLWWNPFEGLGAPLAGEMQSAALFPPTLLLLLPNGQVIEHLLFQIVAALATYALLRQLRAGRTGAWTAGALFGFNGVFAWIANAVINPVCFLPVMLLGLERLRSGQRRSAALLVACGLAGSIYAGFPEVAYLDGLLAGVWVLCRAGAERGPERWRYLSWVALSAVAGLLLTAPLLVAFADMIAAGHVGPHGASMAQVHIPAAFAFSVLVPYFFGNLLGQQYDFWPLGQQYDFWGNIGGYAGVGLTALAIAGALGRTERSLRLALAGWAAWGVAIVFGAQPLLWAFHLIPLTGQAAIYRYLDASWIMAMCVLAGLAVDDIRAEGGRRVLIGVVAVAALLIGSIALAAGYGLKPGHAITTLGSVAVQIGALCIIAVTSGTGGVRPWWRPRIIAAAAVVEAVMLFAAPIAANPYRVDVDLGGIAFLRTHLGMQRFVTTGPIAANYGSFYQIAQVNHNDLPVPQDWVDYAHRHLDPEMDPIILRARSAERLLASLPAYAAIGTRFVVVAADRPIPSLKQVHADRVARIYAIPGTRPYFSADGCAVAARSRTEAVVTCARPSSLERLELFMPGWGATVDGRARAVARTGEVFQAVAVPAGVSVVRFRFVPPGMGIGYLLALVGTALLLLLASGFSARFSARRMRGLNSPPARAT